MTVFERRVKMDAFIKAINDKDPYRIAEAIDLPKTTKVAKKYNSGHLDDNKKKYKHLTFVDKTGVDWSTVYQSLLEACNAYVKGDVISCHIAQTVLHGALNHIFGSSNGNLLVPALHTVCLNTHRIAVLADIVNIDKVGRNDHSKLQVAITLLQESYSKTFNDRKEFVPNASLSEEGSKKAGVLFIVNQLFSMYFRLNTLRLCKNLLLPVESRGLHQEGAMGEMVTYRYYVGRFNMFEDNYQAAEEALDYAFYHCHREAMANKKRILNCLIPVKMMRGRLPTNLLLKKYTLDEFVPLVDGIRKGDLRTFNEGLRKYQYKFFRQGSYLLLEKTKIICYRNLYKRVYKVMNKRPQLSLDRVAHIFRWLGMDTDLDEIECILANLIYRGYIRGYISHSKRILVLSKNNPFPISAIICK